MPIAKYRRSLQIVALSLAALLALGLSGVLTPRPAPRYTVTDLGVLPGYAESSASAINSRGEVAVTVSGATTRAAIFRGGRLTDLGVLPVGSDSKARGMNSAGDITGVASLPTGKRAFLYSGGKMQDLGTPPGFQDSTGAGINDRGEVAVSAMSSPMQPGPAQGRAFVYKAGKMTQIKTPLGCSESHALGINAAGQVVGDCRWAARRVGGTGPFLFDGRTGAMTILPVPAPYLRSGVSHISDDGRVIGDVSLPGFSCHAAVWRGNQMTDLGAPSGYPSSVGEGINSRGEAVGNCFLDPDSLKGYLAMHAGANNALRRYLERDTEHAFVYRGGRMQDLNDLIPRDADWTLERARAINDRGQIVGAGLHHGQERAYLLTPAR